MYFHSPSEGFNTRGLRNKKIRQSEPSDPSRPTVGRNEVGRISLSDGVLRNVKILRRFSEKNIFLANERIFRPAGPAQTSAGRISAVFRPADPVRVNRRPTAVFRPKKKKVQSVRLDHMSVKIRPTCSFNRHEMTKKRRPA